MKFFLQAIAVVFHPLFMPLFGAWIVLNKIPFFTFSVPNSLKYLLYTLLLVVIIFQIIILAIMRRRNMISNFQISDRRERSLPIILVIFFYIFIYSLLKYRHAEFMLPDEIYGMFMGVIISLAGAFVISFVFKLSIHMLGICGILGVVMALSMNYDFNHHVENYWWINGLGLFIDVNQLSVSFLWISGLAICAGLVGSSRIYTGNHTFTEIVTGGALGFLINYIVMI